MELLLLLVAALQFVPATGQRRDGEFCVIISDIHKNSLCTQPSIGTLWTGLNHPIAHNPYSLSRVSPEAQCSKAPRFHQCSTPAARRVPAKWGNPTPLSTVPQNQVGKIVEARLRFGTAEVSGFSRPSHFRPSGKSRRFFVHRPMPPILILPQLPQPPPPSPPPTIFPSCALLA